MPSFKSEDARPQPRRNAAALWLIIALCAAPMVAAYVAYYVWQPSGHVNYGELVTPRPLPDAPLVTSDGRTMKVSDLKRKWVLLLVRDARCDDRCRRDLIYTRQVRLAEGVEQERIAVVWIVSGAGEPDARFMREDPGLIAVHDPSGEIARALSATGTPLDRIYVADPLGNLMMRFPPDPDPRRILKDMSRLLRHSKWK